MVSELEKLQDPQADILAEGTTAVDALDKGFVDLMALCDVVADKFVAARNDYSNQMQW